jgi:hypothetical protein
MTKHEPRALCLECWRETGSPIIPVGYYNVSCLRHYNVKEADQLPDPIMEKRNEHER